MPWNMPARRSGACPSKGGSPSAISRSRWARAPAWWRPTTSPSTISAGRDFAPKDALWDRAVAHWRTLPSDADAEFDREHTIDMGKVAPQITWGTSPEHVIAVDRPIPDPTTGPEDRRRAAWTAALQYRASSPASRSRAPRSTGCSSARAPTAASPTCAPPPPSPGAATRPTTSTAWIVPGSERVKREAEAEGLDKVFRDAGFEWREPGCSMCIASNGERVPPGAAQRLDLQPQLRRPPGPRRAHPSRQPGDGRGRARSPARHRRRAARADD